MSKKVKNILFKIEMDGQGIVNYDSNSQKNMYYSSNLQNVLYSRHKNVSYAKKDFINLGTTTKEDGTVINMLDYKIKISSDCIKKEIFGDDVIAQTPNISLLPELLYSYLSSPVSFLRGYLFASKEEIINKKGSILLTDAIQTCNAKSSLETFSRSGEKVEKIDDSEEINEKSDNTFYKKETIGEIKYSSKGSINMEALQFISADKVFGRYSFNPDYFSIISDCLKALFKNFDSELGYYLYNTSSIKIPEYGYSLSDENIVEIVQYFFKKMLSMNIKRKNAYAKITNLQIKFVYDAIEDTFESENGWITLSNNSDIDNINFDVFDYYSKYNESDATELRANIVKRQEELKALEKGIKVAEKEKKASKKESAKN